MKSQGNEENCVKESFIILLEPYNIKTIKSRRIRLAGHVARMGR
jgi:hypothetical protein